MQFAVTLTAAATNAGKENRDTSGAAAKRTRRDILFSQRRGWWEVLDTAYATESYHFEGLSESCTCDEGLCQWAIVVPLCQLLSLLSYATYPQIRKLV